MLDLDNKIREAVESIVKERFDNVEIVRVDVEEGRDHDGEDVLYVRVVFDADVNELRAERMSGLVRHLRSRLGELGETRFPLTRYLSKSDYEGAAA